MDAIILGILSFLVAVLATMQGYQMLKHRNNPNRQLDKISSQLNNISHQLGKMEMRLDDIWEKVK